MIKQSKGTGARHETTPAMTEAMQMNWVSFCLRGMLSGLMHPYLVQYLKPETIAAIKEALNAALNEAAETSRSLKGKRNGKAN